MRANAGGRSVGRARAGWLKSTDGDLSGMLPARHEVHSGGCAPEGKGREQLQLSCWGHPPDTPTCALPVLKGSSSLGVAMVSSAGNEQVHGYVGGWVARWIRHGC